MHDRIIIISLLIFLSCPTVFSGESVFVMRGYAHSGIEFEEGKSSFVGGSFNPIFLWRQSEKLLFESELHMGFGDEAAILDIEYANFSYLIGKYVTMRFGKFILPFGIFSERIHPAWINKFPTAPMGIGHGSLGPASDLGIEARGGVPIGPAKLAYAVYIINGPQLNVTDSEPGKLEYAITDNNTNKSVGGRLGLLPFSNSALEIGISGLTGIVGPDNTPQYNVRGNLLAADISIIKSIPMLPVIIDVKGEFDYFAVDETSYPTDEPGEMFKNTSWHYFVQLGLRPTISKGGFINNLELALRYAQLEHAHHSPWSDEADEIAIGLNYWLDWRTVFKLSFIKGGESGGGGGHGHGEESDSEIEPASDEKLLIHWAIGF